MAKFKKGDSVKILKPKSKNVDGCNFNSDMEKLIGRVGKIISAELYDDDTTERYTISIDDERWNYVENWLELVTKKIEVGDTVIEDGYDNKGKVVAIFANEHIKKDYLVCVDDDGGVDYGLIEDYHIVEEEVVEMTVAEISKLVGKTVKIVE